MKSATNFQSKWGYHPCDYQLFLKLKSLHRWTEGLHAQPRLIDISLQRRAIGDTDDVSGAAQFYQVTATPLATRLLP